VLLCAALRSEVGMKVLIMSPDYKILCLMTLLVEKMGFEVFQAMSEEDAKSELKTIKADFVLLDNQNGVGERTASVP